MNEKTKELGNNKSPDNILPMKKAYKLPHADNAPPIKKNKELYNIVFFRPYSSEGALPTREPTQAPNTRTPTAAEASKEVMFKSLYIVPGGHVPSGLKSS